MTALISDNFSYNTAGKLTESNSTACMEASISHQDTLMTSANKYLIENAIKQLLNWEVQRALKKKGCSWLRLEQFLHSFLALQTSRMLQFSMKLADARTNNKIIELWHVNVLLQENCQSLISFLCFVFSSMYLLLFSCMVLLLSQMTKNQ